MSCPPHDDSAGADAVQAYLDAGGDTVIYIGEGFGGCTGDARMFELLKSHFEEDNSAFQGAQIPTWDGMHDQITLYRRK